MTATIVAILVVLGVTHTVAFAWGSSIAWTRALRHAAKGTKRNG